MNLAPIMLLLMLTLIFSGCCRNSNEVWEDTKSASRHMNRGVSSLAGKHGDSRAVRCKEEFYPIQNCYSSPSEPEYIPIPDYQFNELTLLDVPQGRETPGDPGSSVPGIEAFMDPATHPSLSRIFRPIHFEYNSNLIKDPEDLQVLKGIANYLRTQPNTYVFIEGHCDERGPQAFNLALGSRRSNSVRNLLVSDGVHPDQLFTISYGKERPAVLEHHEEAWAQNRRAEFKVYAR